MLRCHTRFTGPGNVFILDLFLKGDEFSLFDSGVFVGSTSIDGQHRLLRRARRILHAP